MTKKTNNTVFEKASIQENLEKGLAKTKETLKNFKFNQLWQAFNQTKKTILINQFKDKALVEDAIQDGFVKFLVEELELEDTNLFGWLYRVVKNQCIDACRKRSVQKNCVSIEKDFELYKEIMSESLVLVEEIERYDWRKLFKYEQLPFETALFRLKTEYKLLWKMIDCYYFQDLPHKKIAMELGISENMSRQRLCEAKQKLRFFLNVELKNM